MEIPQRLGLPYLNVTCHIAATADEYDTMSMIPF